MAKKIILMIFISLIALTLVSSTGCFRCTYESGLEPESLSNETDVKYFRDDDKEDENTEYDNGDFINDNKSDNTVEEENSGLDLISYPIVDTGQESCFDDSKIIGCPEKGEPFFGQDAQFTGNMPAYLDNGDGTITDLNTGLMWQKDPGEKMIYDQAVSGSGSFYLAGYDDWRLPSIKELYSLIVFSGTDPSGPASVEAIPFIDTDFFEFDYGDEDKGERLIDSQFISSTKYVSTTMNNADTVFGVNFADGRIKGYPTGPMPNKPGGKEFFVLYVRGNIEYGINDFIDNGDGTITDYATGLMWSQDDSSIGMTWQEALTWVQQKNDENYLGYNDWRLPNSKELQSIVDYSRSPDTTASAAIDEIFEISELINEADQKDYPFFWTSTTHIKSNGMGDNAVYISFGRALGYMEEFGGWIDVHGAGAQRSDPKSGDPDDYPSYFGPQGDVNRLFNYVRLVRDTGIIDPKEKTIDSQGLEG